jgi:FKBP-type peptidyl-prolyl cis-trans isomerase (trigger factor)
MKALSLKIEKLVLTAELQLDPEEFALALKDAYLENSDRFVVPGVAAGLASRKDIEELYGPEALFDEALAICVPKKLSDFLEERSIRIIGRPKMTELGFSSGVPSFVVTADVYPEIELGPYKGLWVSEKKQDDEAAFAKAILSKACQGMKTEISEALIEQRLTSLLALEKLAIRNEPLYPLLADATATLGWAYRETGAFRPGTQIKTEALDVVLETLAQESENQTLANLAEKMNLLVARFREPPVDFAETIREKLEAKRRETASRPEQARLDESFAAYLFSRGLDVRQWRAHSLRLAEDLVRSDLLLDGVAKAERLSVTDEEMNDELAKIAAECGLELPQGLAAIDLRPMEAQLLRDKALRFLVDNAADSSDSKTV